MGGKSSKQKISSASQSRCSNATASTLTPTITIDDGSVVPQGKKHKKKELKKSKSKDKENIEEVTNGKKNKKTKHDGCQNHKRISFEENTLCSGGHGGGSHEHRSRKKSACPSCDARDMLLDQVRSRSGSLRYTDFNKVVRQSRIYDVEELPADVPLDGVPDPLPEVVCFVCGVYTGCVTRSCRVCRHVYHNGCLHKIGQTMDQRAIQLAQVDMWSCHQCSDVSRLLTREETQYVFNSLEGLDVDPDSVTLQNYIEYKEKMHAALGKIVTQETKLSWVDRFNFVADGGDGNKQLDWTQFLQAETISILRSRCKDSVIKMMTEMEFAEARKMFRGMMGESGDTVTMAQVKDRILQLYCKFGCRVWSENQEDVTKLDEVDFDRNVSWSEFLAILSIHMITVRENNLSFVPPTENGDGIHGNNTVNGATAPSFDSIDDDEDYRTCESDLDSPTAAETRTQTEASTADYDTIKSQRRISHKKNLSDVQILNDEDDANKSLSILEDLSKAFNLDGRARKSQNNETISENVSSLNTCNIENSTDLPTASEFESATTPDSSSTMKRHLWHKSPAILDDPNFTTSVDISESREKLMKVNETSSHVSLEKSPMISKRRSEVLVRPSTEEGRSPRKALSQKLVAPAYGLVDKMQSQDWNW